MALIKQKTARDGTVGEYWMAESSDDKINNRTNIRLYLFKDAQARADGLRFMERTSVPAMEGTYKSGEDIYAHITASRMVEQINEQTGETETIESNFFVDAVSDE